MCRVHCAALNVRTPPGSWVGGATSSQRYGGHGERETPGPIPNPEAKPLSADGTARATAWESRTSPDTTCSEGCSVRRTALAVFSDVKAVLLCRMTADARAERRDGNRDPAPAPVG